MIDIIIRNIKLHILSGEKLEYPFNEIYEILENIFNSLELIEDNGDICIVDSDREIRFYKSRYGKTVYTCTYFWTGNIFNGLEKFKKEYDSFVTKLTEFYLSYKFPKICDDSICYIQTIDLKEFLSPINDTKYI